MSTVTEEVWASVDVSTHRENSAANHGTAHGFGFIRAALTRTATVADTDTNATTATNTTPVSITQPDAFQ